LKALLGVIGALERFGLGLAILALVGLIALGSAEMVLRTFFATGLSVSLEYSGYLVAIAFLAGSGWTLADGGHIRVQFLEDRFDARARRILGLLTAFVAFITVTVLVAGLAAWTFGSFNRGTTSFYPSATPLWWPQAAVTLAAAILDLSILGQLIRTWRSLRASPASSFGTGGYAPRTSSRPFAWARKATLRMTSSIS